MASQDLCAELRCLQALLSSSPGAGSIAGATHLPPPPPPPPLPIGDNSSDDSDEEPPSRRRIKAAGAHSQQQTNSQILDLERQLASAQQKSREDADRCRRLEEALEAAQRDGALVGSRLRAELLAKQEECAQLAELAVQLREEADGLRQQLHCTSAAAQRSGQTAQMSLEQLQAAAAEWRQHGEDSLEALAEERERTAALRAEVTRLHAQAQVLTRELTEAKEKARMAAAEAAGLNAAAAVVGSPAGVVADLRARLSQERAWRKAVCRWLEGEMATRANLERVLVNVGTAARTGAECSSTCWSGRPAPAPPLPPRRMAASQLVPQPPQSPTAVHVTVHSPPGGHTLMVGVDSTVGGADCSFDDRNGGCSGGSKGSQGSNSSSRRGQNRSMSSSGNSGGAGSSSVESPGNSSVASKPKGDWREHFKETMRAFDERHSRLQAELSTLRREALLQTA